MTDTMHELSFERTIAASPDAIYRCWTEPALIARWFAPVPYTVAHAELDPRPGGAQTVTMRSPDGDDIPNTGVYLELVPGRRIVFTDAYRPGWTPSPEPFFTAVIDLEPVAGGTRYRVSARHFTEDACRRHEEMGFYSGWGQCADQLAEVAAGL